MPSPVATAGFVVSRKTCPAPPVASSVASARKLLTRAGSIEERDAADAAVFDQQLRDERVMNRLDRRQAADALPEHAADFPARSRRRHAAPAARCAPPRARARASTCVPLEARAPVEQLAHVRRPLLDEHAYGLLVAQPVARANRVGRVQLRTVVVADRRGDAALRVAGVALVRIGLRQHGDAPGRRERDGRPQSRDAAADDQEISVTHKTEPQR